MTESQCIFCVNCGSASGSMVLDNEHILQCIQQWTAPRLVEPHDLICTTCWTEALETRDSNNVGRRCVLCNTTLPPRTRSHEIISLRTDTEHNMNIRNIILERLRPLQARASHLICHPCWQQADRAAKHYSTPSTSRAPSCTSNQLRCVNCGINIHRMRRHILNNHLILVQVQRQVAPRVVTAADYICKACHRVLMERNHLMQGSEDPPLVGHQSVCLGCGCSLAQGRTHAVQAENNRHILQIVQNWIQPQQVQPSHLICHRCFQRAEVSARAMLPDRERDPDLQDPGRDLVPQSTEILPHHTERITLPNYCRAPDTHARCIFPLCGSTTHQMVPNVIRVRLFADHKYYTPKNSRICARHLETQEWTDLLEVETPNHSFTMAHIEDFCALLKTNRNKVDFANVEGMEDNLLWYLLGRTKEQFRELEAELPDFPNRATALGAYLMKLRTEDSDERIAKLLDMARSTLTKLVTKARDMLIDFFVPAHLGLGHITRRQVAEKNLYIPNSLFGNPGSSTEDRKAIIILDGTYIFVQKSSNYAYQKKSYSLHKYRNLVKPFLIVCCEGYIVDVLGPYPATKSDADILTDEFSDPSKPLRQYLREGDVMILDRGFRDSIPLLESLNYSIHYPLSLEENETQMSTTNANESRKVTLCRWVVEVVNGRFKRDFKLLRQEYFNRASTHLMKDFMVAAALINRFHRLLQDRADAREIVSVIQEKMFL